MITVLYILLILTCIVLIISVLLQPGKADAGALFSSAISSTAFGPRGTQTLLAKITIGAAAVFMLIAIAISLSSDNRPPSKMESETGGQQQTTPTPAASPATPPAQEGGANTNATANTGAGIESKAPTSPATGQDTGSATQPQPSPSQ